MIISLYSIINLFFLRKMQQINILAIYHITDLFWIFFLLIVIVQFTAIYLFVYKTNAYYIFSHCTSTVSWLTHHAAQTKVVPGEKSDLVYNIIENEINENCWKCFIYPKFLI